MKNPLKLVDRRSVTVLIGAFTLVTLVAVIVIILKVSSVNQAAADAESERRRNESQAITNSTRLGIEDFYLDNRDPDVGTVYPARSPRSTWTEAEVGEYWIDPSEAGLDTLTEDNDRLIRESIGAGGGGE